MLCQEYSWIKQKTMNQKIKIYNKEAVVLRHSTTASLLWASSAIIGFYSASASKVSALFEVDPGSL